MGVFCSTSRATSTKSIQDESVENHSQVSLGTLTVTEDPLLLEMGFDSRVSRLYDAVEVVQDEAAATTEGSSTITTICKVRRKTTHNNNKANTTNKNKTPSSPHKSSTRSSNNNINHSNRAFLLKRIVAENPVLMLRWYHTIDLYKSLQHKNLPRLIDVHDDDDDDDNNENASRHKHPHHVSFVMELCEGGNILERCNGNSYTESQVRKMVRQILEVVKYLHSQNIVHGDLRAEWFLFDTNDAKKWNIKLMDFSIARQLTTISTDNNTNSAPPRVLHDHEVGLFTTAPECLLDGREHSKAGDMWSVGIIIYQLLAGGKLPFVGSNANTNTNNDTNKDEFIHNIRVGNAPPTFDSKEEDYDKCWDTISTPAKNLIQKLLNLEPKARLTAEQALKHPWLSSFYGGKLSFTSLSLH